MIAWSIGRVQGQQDQSKGKVVFVSADQANFHEMTAGVSMAAIWGDADNGARTPHSPSSRRDTMPGCTPIPMTFGS
jgi:hypothetical protein